MIKGIKICGISDSKTLSFILNHSHPAKFVGFIVNYKKSKRYVEFEKLKNLVLVDKKQTSFVSVLVNPTNDDLEKIKELNFDYYQLYDVDPNRTKHIKDKYKIKIITALTVFNKEDVDKYKIYSEISDIILFDSKGYDKSESFDHNLLNDLPSDLDKMIAGNIQINDISNFNNKDYHIDLSGSVENSEGKKDINKIDKLLNLVAKYEA